jgi:hypothetical protein
MASGEFHPDLVINMDESEFCRIPLKTSQKNCAFTAPRRPGQDFLTFPTRTMFELWQQLPCPSVASCRCGS